MGNQCIETQNRHPETFVNFQRGNQKVEASENIVNCVENYEQMNNMLRVSEIAEIESIKGSETSSILMQSRKSGKLRVVDENDEYPNYNLNEDLMLNVQTLKERNEIEPEFKSINFCSLSDPLRNPRYEKIMQRPIHYSG